jgi:hypothetical protein
MMSATEAAEIGYCAWRTGKECPFTGYDEDLQQAWAQGYVTAAGDFLSGQLDQFQRAALELMEVAGHA